MSGVSNIARSRTVFVGNLPFDAQEDELKNIFSRAGAVECFRLVLDKDTNQPKGYGFCDFIEPESAQNAVKKLHEVEYSGRRLRLDLADVSLRGRDGPLPPSGHAPAPLALPSSGPVPSQAPRAFPSMPSMPSSLPGFGSLGPLGGFSGALPTGAATATDPAAHKALIAAAEAENSAHAEIAQAIAAMPRAQMQLCLGSMQRLAKEAPEMARAMLQEHPQLCYALLQAQLHLGLALDPSEPPSEEELQLLRAKAARRTGPLGMPGMMRGLIPVGIRPLMPQVVAPVQVPPNGMGLMSPAAAGLQGKAAPSNSKPLVPGLQ